MNISLRKQPIKYIDRLVKPLSDLKNLEGDIVKLRGTKYYRLRLQFFNILFVFDNNNDIIIEAINIRPNARNERYQ